MPRWSQSDLEIIIYLIILSLDNRAYTNQILRIVSKATGQPINYASIHWFVRKGERDRLLKSWWEEEGNRLVRFFALTPRGVKNLHERLAQLEGFPWPVAPPKGQKANRGKSPYGRERMKVKELLAALAEATPEAEVILQRDSDGNGFSPLEGIDLEAVYGEDGEVYCLRWGFNEAGWTNEEWKTIIARPHCVLLYPTN